MSQTKRAAESAFLIIVLSLVGKMLGFLREIFIGAKFGSGILTDTYVLSMSAIALFSTLITQAINTTTIPVLSEVEKVEGKESKIVHTSNLLNIISIFSIVIIIFAYFLSPLIIQIIAPAFVDDQFNLAVNLMRVGLPSILLSGIQGVLRGFLQSEGSFTETAFLSFPTNFVFLAYLIFFADNMGVTGLMITSVLGILSQIIIQVYGIKKLNFKYSLKFDLKDQYIQKILYLIPPVLISVGISDLNSLIDKSMASTLVSGSISALNYAGKLTSLITGIFISSITVVLFPILSQAAASKRFDNLKNTIIRGINIILLITIPSTFGLIILANPIVKTAFQRGAFDETATYMTAGALVYIAVRLSSSSINSLLASTFYSLQDTKITLKVGISAVIINVMFNIILMGPMGHKGLALATTISSFSRVVIYIYILRKRIGAFGFLRTLKSSVKILLAASVMGLSVYFIHPVMKKIFFTLRLADLFSLGSTIGVGVIIYFVLIYFLKIEEVDWAIRILRERFSKKNKAYND